MEITGLAIDKKAGLCYTITSYPMLGATKRSFASTKILQTSRHGKPRRTI